MEYGEEVVMEEESEEDIYNSEVHDEDNEEQGEPEEH